MKKIKSTSKNAIPVVESGLKTVGSTAKLVATKSTPVVEKGLSGVYGALATGFDFGLKKLKNKSYKKSKRVRHHKKTRRH